MRPDAVTHLGPRATHDTFSVGAWTRAPSVCSCDYTGIVVTYTRFSKCHGTNLDNRNKARRRENSRVEKGSVVGEGQIHRCGGGGGDARLSFPTDLCRREKRRRCGCLATRRGSRWRDSRRLVPSLDRQGPGEVWPEWAREPRRGSRVES